MFSLRTQLYIKRIAVYPLPASDSVCLLQDRPADEPQRGARRLPFSGRTAQLRSALAERDLHHPDQTLLPVRTGHQVPPPPHPQGPAGMGSTVDLPIVCACCLDLLIWNAPCS